MKFVVTQGVLLLSLLMLAGCNPVRPVPGEMPGEATATAEAPANVSAAAPIAGAAGSAAAIVAGELASQLGIDSSAVTVVSSEAVEWPDACLGVTVEGEMCAQVITPGYKIVLSANGNTYTYHTDQSGSSYRVAAGQEPQTGEHAAGLKYEGPAESGTDDTSRCASLQIGGSEVSVQGCDGIVTTVPLSENLMSTWTDITDRFGNFVYETPGERLTFQGMGDLVDPMWQRALLAWARVTRAELASGRTSATARTALSWNLGPVPDTPDVCAHLTVLDYGYAYAEQRACAGTELVSTAEDWLTQAEMQQFDRWLYGYAPLYVRDNYLNSAGQEQMPDAEAGSVQTWAGGLWTRLSGMPLAPAAADADSSNGAAAGNATRTACDEPAGDGQVYSSSEYGFCILVPAGYAVVESAPGSLNLVAGGDLMNHTSPRMGIEVSAAGDRTLAGITDQMLQDFAPLGMNIVSQTISIDGNPAMLLDNLPGQDLNRRVVVMHNNRVYSIMFMPLTPEAEPFYQSVLDSLRFLD